MAEDEIEVGEEKAEGKSSLKWIVLGVTAVLAIAAAAGWFFLSNGSEQNTDASSRIKVDKPIKEKGFGQIFSLEPFIVNLSDPGGKRYLKVRIDLEFRGKGFEKELTARMPQLRDSILLVLSSMKMVDIQSVDGKLELKRDLIRRINELLKQGKIRNLYFTEFVIQ